jgi:hypothetical protein
MTREWRRKQLKALEMGSEMASRQRAILAAGSIPRVPARNVFGQAQPRAVRGPSLSDGLRMKPTTLIPLLGGVTKLRERASKSLKSFGRANLCAGPFDPERGAYRFAILPSAARPTDGRGQDRAAASTSAM